MESSLEALQKTKPRTRRQPRSWACTQNTLTQACTSVPCSTVTTGETRSQLDGRRRGVDRDGAHGHNGKQETRPLQQHGWS